ncbi:hypothetical protein CVIRNUC_007411 [Coccomyxa viridis]|uniref:BRCT domain-containing protein n=1 Tax=Coccomyxa viridis TaxID=1274662 RepID=A0AAV1IBX1_9CHLO|nr:hypothetical protein CVIRNUC_007411 [Coccomyxa viridis]
MGQGLCEPCLVDTTQPWEPKSCFEGLVLAASEEDWSTYNQFRCKSILEAGGGKAVTLKFGKAACTHVLVKHKGQSSYDWGLKALKPLVNPLWLWDSYEAAEVLPLQDPVWIVPLIRMYAQRGTSA